MRREASSVSEAAERVGIVRSAARSVLAMHVYRNFAGRATTTTVPCHARAIEHKGFKIPIEAINHETGELARIAS
jgi:hypothetical protein